MKTHKPHPVHQLDNLLRYWESHTFLMGLTAIASGKQDADTQLRQRLFHSWSNFRSFIMNYDGDPLTADYFSTKSTLNLIEATLGLLAWNHYSRRVYGLTEDLQIVLSTTSVGAVSWDEIRFPFESFFVTLPTPILNRNGDKHDSILFFRTQPGWGCQPDFVAIMPIPTDLERCCLRQAEKQRLLSLYRNQEPSRMIAFIDELHQEGRMLPLPTVTEVLGTGKKIIDTIERPFVSGKHNDDIIFEGKNWPEWQQAIRIVVGLCLHLDNRPGGGVGEWVPVPRVRQLPDRRAISNSAQICTVANVYPLTERERNRFRSGEGLYEVSAHWRTAHKRRPPGKGHDPTAEKTVKIPWVHVRKDRLEPGELPGGSAQVLK